MIFQNRLLPSNCKLIGFSWLINHFDLKITLRELSCISLKRLASQHIQKESWTQFDASFKIDERPYAHLEFALKHETLDLLVLKNILAEFPTKELIDMIGGNPKRILNKKIWFYYEFLLHTQLPLEDLPWCKE